MENNEKKYIKLLLERCLNFNKSKSLLISYDKVNKSFVDHVVEYAKTLGVNDIYLDEDDINTTKEKLENLTLDEIEQDPYFDKTIWDEYAKKDASFLMLETEFPNELEDIDPLKIAKAKYINRTTRELFRKKEASNEIPWCIAALPNEKWARSIFPNEDNAYEKLYEVILNMCMVDKEDPIKSWNEHLNKLKKLSTKLTDLKITKLHYKNSLGTDLTIELPSDVIWNSAAGSEDSNMLVNMPSYEIFTSPNYLKTNGIVYSAKPLIYGGGKIDEFYIEFKDGKVVNYDAKKGKEILKQIIESDENSCYLGEVALVNNNSPISNTNLVFGTTLFDENASCHLALGDGFPDSIKDGLTMTKEELLGKGINQSKNHVDFMIGTKDLEIKAETKEGSILIFENGNFVI